MRPILIAIFLSILSPALTGGAGAFESDRGLAVLWPDGTKGTLLPDRAPFGPGEIIDYDLKYEFVKLGKARLEVEKRMDYRGRECLLLVSRAKSGKVADTFYKVRDEIRSILDLEHLYSLYYSKHLREGKYSNTMKAIYYHEEGVAKYEDGQEMDFLAGSQDILSALYVIRLYPLQEGMTLEIPVHDGKKNYPLQVNVLAREPVRTEGGEVMCFLLEPRLESQGLFKSEGRMQIYLSDDKRRIPVLLKAKAPIGEFLSELSRYVAGESLELPAPR